MLGKVGGYFDVEMNHNLPNCEAVELMQQVQAQNEITELIIITDNLGDDCGIFP